jgi:hypothetical protein
VGGGLTSSCFWETTGHFTRRTYSVTMVSTHAIRREYWPLEPLMVMSATSYESQLQVSKYVKGLLTSTRMLA